MTGMALFARCQLPTSQAIHLLRSFSSRRMSSAPAPFLLSPSEVNDLIKSGTTPVSLLDATWFMPNSPRNANDEFLAKRIPGSQRLDLDEVASPHELGVKHMMPESQTFASACEKLGISPSIHVVLYDTHGIFSAPRALFMFRSFGHQNSSILNGGLPRWADEGLPVDTDAPKSPEPAIYIPLPQLNEQALRSYEQIVANSRSGLSTNAAAELVLDARPKGRYAGIDPEPRPGLSSGHIPHAFSLTFNLLLQKHKAKDGQEYSTFLPPAEIRKALDDAVGPVEAEKIIRGERSVVASCGSGMTAGVLWVGLQLLDVKQVAIYDESWTGYAMRPSSVIEKST